MACENCNIADGQNFCPNCGAPMELTRINGQYILQEIGSVLNFKKGILYTIRELLIRPGQNVNEFIHRDRNRLVKPILFVIITSLIYMLAQQLLHFEDGYMNAGGIEDSAVVKILGWIQSNYGYANILMAFFIAAWIKIFFRKSNYNFFEILILLCFIMGVGMLMYTFFGIVESTTKMPVLQLGGLSGLLYAAWAIGQFFDGKKKMSYLKGFSAYLLGSICFFVAAIALGMMMDWMKVM